MCRVREKFWVPKMRSLTKKVIRNWKNIWATGKWLFTLKKDHNLASYIGALNKRWKFNLARAPWWGGFFKHPTGHDHEKGTFKGSWPKPSDLFRAGRYLDWHRELYEPSTTTSSGRGIWATGAYPNILLRGKPTPNVDEDLETIGEEKVSRRMKFLQRRKEYFQRRFLKEYAHAIGERKV